MWFVDRRHDSVLLSVDVLLTRCLYCQTECICGPWWKSGSRIKNSVRMPRTDSNNVEKIYQYTAPDTPEAINYQPFSQTPPHSQFCRVHSMPLMSRIRSSRKDNEDKIAPFKCETPFTILWHRNQRRVIMGIFTEVWFCNVPYDSVSMVLPF